MKLERQIEKKSKKIKAEHPLIAGLAWTRAEEPRMGTGACSHWLCGCQAYASDSTHSGTCTCGHTAAVHA
jgi:hypothetical protein